MSGSLCVACPCKRRALHTEPLNRVQKLISSLHTKQIYIYICHEILIEIHKWFFRFLRRVEIGRKLKRAKKINALPNIYKPT